MPENIGAIDHIRRVPCIGWANLKGSNASLTAGIFPYTKQTKIDGIGLFAGQVGYAFDNVLWYVKGGAAVTSNRFTTFDTLPGVGLASLTTTRWGGALGTGLEVGFAPNWSVGMEYDHLFMGNGNTNTNTNTFVVTTPLVAGVNRINEDVDMITVRLNYRFGGYGAPPVAARY